MLHSFVYFYAIKLRLQCCLIAQGDRYRELYKYADVCEKISKDSWCIYNKEISQDKKQLTFDKIMDTMNDEI